MYVIATSPRFSLGRSTPATLAIVALRSFHRRRPRRPPFERRLRRRNLSWGEVPEGGNAPLRALPLPGLVPRVLADHARHPAAPDDLTVLASRFDRRPHLHRALALAFSCSSAGSAGATPPGGRYRKGGEAPLRAI